MKKKNSFKGDLSINDIAFDFTIIELKRSKEINNLSVDIKIFDRDNRHKIFEVKDSPPILGMKKARAILEHKG